MAGQPLRGSAESKALSIAATLEVALECGSDEVQLRSDIRAIINHIRGDHPPKKKLRKVSLQAPPNSRAFL